MWSEDYGERLRQWRDIRHKAANQDIDAMCNTINDWWWQAPMVNHTLSWNNPDAWPDPWQLLQQQNWCGLARALGMLYTIMLVEHSGITDIDLIAAGDDNLVQVNQGLYILNWAPRQLLNIQSFPSGIQRGISSTSLKKLIG